MLIIDGGSGDIFNFKLADNYGNEHFYELYVKDFDAALKIAEKWFIEEYGHKPINVEKNVTGFPKTSSV